ncbi:DUF6493 family protein [Moraxella sp. K1664]|uniref:DUF6493 family protein n=1 Tax=Moraxella sp. K1664 TaxID=2780077 RepID=UPI0018807CEE|nr:DUF6493 family protein [Moraxella sp. K1664]MBE9579075.1 hypothetical protein [Moraxella sp. K1664]
MTQPAPKTKKDILAEFDHIIATGELSQIIPFLDAHKQGNVSELKKQLNKARRYYLDRHEVKENGRTVGTGVRGTPNHERMLFCLALALLSPSDFNGRWFDCFAQVLRYMSNPDYYKSLDNKNNTTPMVFDIIKHFDFKELFNAFTAECVKREIMWGLDYPLLRRLENDKLIDHHPQLFAMTIARFTMPNAMPKKKLSIDEYREFILSSDILVRDVKLLFEYETDVSWVSFDYLDRQTFKEYKNGEFWLYFIPEFIKQGKLDRQFVLQKCLEIQTGLWKTTSKSFFKELFKALSPTIDELITHQEQIFVLLHSDYKPAVNFAIELIKQIILDERFLLDEFIEFVSPVMMNADFKGGIKSLLVSFDKLLKTKPHLIKDLYPIISSVLFVNELALQERAVKILAKYANKKALDDEYDNLQNTLHAIYDTLPNDIKSGLAPIYTPMLDNGEHDLSNNVSNEPMNDTGTDYYYDNSVNIDYFADERKITLYDDFNELLFNFGQLEHGDNPIEIEIYMASYLALKQQGKFPSDDNTQLKSVLDKYRHQWSDNDVFTIFETEFLNHIYQNKDEKIGTHQYKFLNSYHAIVKQFIALDKINDGKSDNPLSLLSTPTHAPAYIEPAILVERLIAYQKAGVEIDLTDYAIALARTPRASVEPALSLLPQITDELIRESLAFAFGQSELPKTIPPQAISEKFGYEKGEHYQAWRGIFATIAKTHYPNIELDYSHEYAKLFDKVVVNDKLGQDYYRKQILAYDWQSGRNIETGSYYIGFDISAYLKYAHTSDIYRQSCYYARIYTDIYDNQILTLSKFLTPLNQTDSDKFLSNYVFDDSEMYAQIALPLLQIMASDDYPYNPYTQFIMTACCFAKDKAIRLAVVDLMSFAISHHRLDIDTFTRHSSEWTNHNSAPFNRYVECIQSLSEYGGDYAVIVKEIIEKTLLKLCFDDKLPTNFKKYLELYYLLLSQSNTKADDEIMTKLHEFVAISGSVKAIVNKIGKL